MGEANRRGTKEKRTGTAIAKHEAIEKAVENREHEDGLVWLVIQVTNSIPVVDDRGAFVMGDDGNMKYGPNHEDWKSMRPEEVPDFIKQDGMINELKNGVEVSWKPEDGGRWFRGLICSPPDKKDQH